MFDRTERLAVIRVMAAVAAMALAAGCRSTPQPATEHHAAPQPTTHPHPLAGLRRVRLEVPTFPPSPHLDAAARKLIEQQHAEGRAALLREARTYLARHLPELGLDGGADEWALVVANRSRGEYDDDDQFRGWMKPPDVYALIVVEVRKSAMVDGRSAVASLGTWSAARTFLWYQELREGKAPYLALQNRALDSFIAQWRAANPGVSK